MKLKYESYYFHGFTEKDILFDKEKFSEFKYGNTSIAKKMAFDLLKYFNNNILNTIENKHLIIYSSPYSQIPTASLFLTRHFVELLVSENPKIKIQLEKIERNNTYSQDYGLMSADQRFQLISKDTYSFKNLPDKEAILIFIDDISITGTHQRVIENLIFENSIKNKIIFLYYAKLTDNSNPSIESYLNNFKIKNWEDLAKLILSPYFNFTTRTIKYILSLNKDEFYLIINFLLKSKPQLINNLQILANSNNYDKIKAYSDNMRELTKVFKQTIVYV